MFDLNTQIMPDSEKTYYYLFSKSGFTDELTEISKADSNVHLIVLDQMCEHTRYQVHIGS